MQNLTIEKTEKQTKTRKAFKIRLMLLSLVILVFSTPMFLGAVADYSRGFNAQEFKQSDAVVDELKETYESFGIKREVLMRFWINGQKYLAPCAMPANRVMRKGELTVLFYNPANPSEAVLTRSIDYDPIIVNGAFGLFGVCLALFMAKKCFS